MDVDSVDALNIYLFAADLQPRQSAVCPDIGSVVASLFGDVDCSGQVDTLDGLLILRHVAGLPASPVPSGCVAIGERLSPP
jgi:hypothetical protein